MVETYVETYRGHDIYHYDPGDLGPVECYSSPFINYHPKKTVRGVRNEIDRKMDVEPPPPPPPPPPGNGFVMPGMGHLFGLLVIVVLAGEALSNLKRDVRKAA